VVVDVAQLWKKRNETDNINADLIFMAILAFIYKPPYFTNRVQRLEMHRPGCREAGMPEGPKIFIL